MLNLSDKWYKVSVKIKLGKDNFSFSLGSGWGKPWATDRLQHTFTDCTCVNKQSPFEPKSWNILIKMMHLYQLHLWNTIQQCFQGIQCEQWTSNVSCPPQIVILKHLRLDPDKTNIVSLLTNCCFLFFCFLGMFCCACRHLKVLKWDFCGGWGCPLQKEYKH